MMRVSKKIKKIVDDENYSAYYVAKKSKVTVDTILKLRKGQRKIKNLTLETAEKLEDFFDSEHKKD